MVVDREFLKREIDTLTAEQLHQVKAFIHALKIASPSLPANVVDGRQTDARQILFDRFKATSTSQPDNISTNNPI